MSNPSLADYAATRQKSRTCAMCVLPERAEFDQARLDGTTMQIIFEWLTGVCGHERLSRHACDTHFQRKHHEA